MATLREQRDASLEAAIHEAEKVIALRKQRDAILELLEQAVGAAELRLAPHLAGKGVAGITDYWLEPAKAVIAGIKQAPEADREFQVVGELEHTGNISPRPR